MTTGRSTSSPRHRVARIQRCPVARSVTLPDAHTDPLLGVLILELHGAEIAEGGTRASRLGYVLSSDLRRSRWVKAARPLEICIGSVDKIRDEALPATQLAPSRPWLIPVAALTSEAARQGVQAIISRIEHCDPELLAQFPHRDDSPSPGLAVSDLAAHPVHCDGDLAVGPLATELANGINPNCTSPD
jgi:hypothetical protein